MVATNGSADAAIDNAKQTAEDAKTLAQHAQATLESAKKALPEIQDRAQKVFSSSVQQLRERTGDASDIANEQIANARVYLIERVQERPFTTTAAVLGAGFILGLLFGGKRR